MKKLLERHYEVTALDDMSTGRRERIPAGVNLIEKAVNATWKNDVVGYDGVIHCAAQTSMYGSVIDPSQDFNRNALSTLHLFETLRRYNDGVTTVFASSGSVVGDIPYGNASEEFDYNPTTLHAVHKMYGEMLCRLYSELYAMKFVVLRLGNVYGPGQPYWTKDSDNFFISSWIRLALEGKPLPIYGSGKQVGDYTYIDDMAEAFLLAYENPRAMGETFLLSSGRGVSLLELAGLVNSLTGNRSGVELKPPRKGDVVRFVGDSSKAARILGWVCKVPLETGLMREVEWVKGEAHRASQDATGDNEPLTPN